MRTTLSILCRCLPLLPRYWSIGVLIILCSAFVLLAAITFLFDTPDVETVLMTVGSAAVLAIGIGIFLVVYPVAPRCSGRDIFRTVGSCHAMSCRWRVADQGGDAT